MVDTNFFSIFTLPMVEGDAKTALAQPDGIVLTQETAEKYFGKGEAIGKIIEINTDSNRVYKVTGIIKNIPSNSHFHFAVAIISSFDATRTALIDGCGFESSESGPSPVCFLYFPVDFSKSKL